MLDITKAARAMMINATRLIEQASDNLCNNNENGQDWEDDVFDSDHTKLQQQGKIKASIRLLSKSSVPDIQRTGGANKMTTKPGIEEGTQQIQGTWPRKPEHGNA